MNVEAYLGKAEAYIGLEDLDAAVKVLEEGYELTGSNEILQKLEELTGRNEEAEIEEAVKDKEESEDEYGVPYYELGFSPEDFTVAGYSVMDGDHVDDVLQAASEIMPHEDDVAFNWEYDGWAYQSRELFSINLIYYTPRFGKLVIPGASYSLYGDGVMIFVCKTLDMNLPADDPANEFPLYEGPIIPNVTSYEESLYILGIGHLIQAIEATESNENGIKSLEFESQYGTTHCSKIEEVQGGISISLYSRQSEKNWYLDFEVEDNVLSMIRLYTE